MPKILDTEIEAQSCSKCGAVRPTVELQSTNGCANCQNLKLMSDQIKATKKSQDEAKENSEKLTATLKNLPDIDKLCTLLYDNERGVWWLGINFKIPNSDPLNLCLVMDQSKVGMIQSFVSWHQQESRKKNLIIGVPDKVKEVVSKISKGAGDVKDRVKLLFTGHA